MAGIPGIFDAFAIKGVTFRSRVLRSSLGGRLAYYDGTPTPAWRNFERRFALAEHRLGGIISATIGVDDRRLSPLEYPKLSHDRFIEPFAAGIRGVHAEGCRYIMQLGDPGGHTHTSLLPEEADGKSASAVFDGYYGYRNVSSPMTLDEIAAEVEAFRVAAKRAQTAGADGVEVTASKGYILHQFLNPATNRRRDAYGGSVENRFRLLKEVVSAVREAVGRDYLFGVRLSAADYNYLPLPNLRWPPVWPPRDYFFGNTLDTTLRYGEWLVDLGVDYLHIDSGFGFVNPKGSPGPYPFEGLRLFSNSARHLSGKANARAAILNLVPKRFAQRVLGTGWRFVPAANAEFARAFKQRVTVPIIANGGFQERDVIEGALRSGACDVVAIGRPLLANPDLLAHFAEGRTPAKPCTWCSQCCTRTAVLPVGCYDATRFASQEQMQEQILRWSSDGVA
jgi:2,4-dienoyl-CoA reductase-like NADH-dependent reductase (Old Yellow Enzyme family)